MEWRGRVAAGAAAAAIGVLLGCKPPPPPVAATPIGRYEQARDLFKVQHKPVEAIAALGDWLKSHPKHPYEPAALYFLARAEVDARRYDAAKATYQRLAKNYGDTDWGQFAREDLTTFDVREPNLPEFQPRTRWWNPGDWFGAQQATVREFELAMADYQQRRYEKALDAFLTLAKANPTSPLAPDALYYAARSQEHLGQADAAKETYQRLLASSSADDWKRLAEERLRRLTE